MNDELNIQVARALTGEEPQMRYCVVDPESGKWIEIQSFGRDTDKAELRPCTPRYKSYGFEYWNVVPDYGGDHAASRELEDEIERRNVWGDYIRALCRLVGTDIREHESVYDDFLFLEGVARLLRAASEQRARAFLEVVKS